MVVEVRLRVETVGRREEAAALESSATTGLRWRRRSAERGMVVAGAWGSRRRRRRGAEETRAAPIPRRSSHGRRTRKHGSGPIRFRAEGERGGGAREGEGGDNGLGKELYRAGTEVMGSPELRTLETVA